jgi:hypothetical protein
MINIIVDDKRARYIFEIIFSIYEIEYTFNSLDKNTLTIIYGENPAEFKGKCLRIFQSDFWEKYKNKESLPKLPLKRFHYNSFRDLIGLYFKKNTKQIVEEKKDCVVLNIDIVASIFFMITRYEEYLQPEIKDGYGRFPATASISYKECFLDRPIVDEYIELLFYLLKKLVPNLKRRENNFTNFVTHDIDYLVFYDNFHLLSLIRDAIKRKDLNFFLKRVKNFYKSKRDYKKDPYWLFDYFVGKEKDVKNAFYFVAEGKKYNIEDRKVKELIKKLNENNCEIGLHGSFNSFNNKEQLKKEKKLLDSILENKKYGVRQHYLRFDVRNTWQVQAELGFEYDTTCGYYDCEGFRCGTSHSFQTYDLERDKILDLKEIPLIAMDVTLKDYRGFQPNEAVEKIKILKNFCKKFGGNFTTLWHNSFFYENEEWKKVYEKAISFS